MMRKDWTIQHKGQDRQETVLAFMPNDEQVVLS